MRRLTARPARAAEHAILHVSLASEGERTLAVAAIEAIHPDGRLSARLDNNRQIEFNASEHRDFDHGAAARSYSSQGRTTESALVHAGTNVHPDLIKAGSLTSPSPAPATRPHSSRRHDKARSQLGADVSRPPFWKSIKVHPLHRELR